MSAVCSHIDSVKVTELPDEIAGCTDCLAIGGTWVHLRMCQSCGHIACCDSSPNRHATKHFHATKHPIIEGYDPPEGWGWCFVDEIEVALAEPTPQRGPIPRWV